MNFQNLQYFLIVAGCTGVFMLIALFFFGLAFSASDPQETYVMSEIYIKSGYGKSSVYLHYTKLKTVIFSRNYIELRGKTSKMRVYIPAEDFYFVKDYIQRHLPGECDIRYE